MAVKEDQDFEIFQGDEVTLAFSLDAGNLLNPTGEWGFSRAPNSQILFMASSDDGHVLFEETNGSWVMKVFLISGNTQSIRPGVYSHIARVFGQNGGGPDVVAVGSMTLRPCTLP